MMIDQVEDRSNGSYEDPFIKNLLPWIKRAQRFMTGMENEQRNVFLTILMKCTRFVVLSM